MIEFVDINGALRGYSQSVFGSQLGGKHTKWHRGVSSAELEDYRPKFWKNQNFLVAFVVCCHGLGESLDLRCFDLVFVLDQEVVDRDFPTYEKLLKQKYCNENIRLITASTLNNDDNVFRFPGLLYYSIRNNHFQEITDLERPYMFDALLGYQKSHRDWLFKAIVESDQLDNSLINYTTNYWSLKIVSTLYRSPDLDKYEDPVVKKTFKDKAYNSYDTYPGKHNAYPQSVFACMIPWNVYRATWFSLVAETFTNQFTFLTEKTAKALYAKRIFWMFGSKGLLKQLKNLGFCTFGDVIDETYDEIDSDYERVKAAFNSALDASKQDPVKLYKHLKPELEYNHHLITSIDRIEAPLKRFITQETLAYYKKSNKSNSLKSPG